MGASMFGIASSLVRMQPEHGPVPLRDWLLFSFGAALVTGCPFIERVCPPSRVVSADGLCEYASAAFAVCGFAGMLIVLGVFIAHLLRSAPEPWQERAIGLGAVAGWLLAWWVDD